MSRERRRAEGFSVLERLHEASEEIFFASFICNLFCFQGISEIISTELLSETRDARRVTVPVTCSVCKLKRDLPEDFSELPQLIDSSLDIYPITTGGSEDVRS